LGLIDSAAAERIASFEANQRNPALLFALAGLGAATVGLGTISIVAANWQGISAGTKLVADLALGVGLATATYAATRRGRAWQADSLCIVYYLFTLASLSLVGQIYQLATPAWQGLTLWTCATLPLVVLAGGRFSGALLAVGLSSTALAGSFELIERIDALLDVPHLEFEAGLTLAFAWPACLLAASSASWLRRERAALVNGFRAILLLATLLGALAAQALWYFDLSLGETVRWAPWFVIPLALGVGFGVNRLFDEPERAVRRGVQLWVALVTVSVLAAAALPHRPLPALSASLQVAVLATQGFVFAQLGRTRSLHWMTALIAIRILIAYVEIFGSMLDTGIGMIIGGVLTLLLAWGWKTASPRLAAALADPGAEDDRPEARVPAATSNARGGGA